MSYSLKKFCLSVLLCSLTSTVWSAEKNNTHTSISQANEMEQCAKLQQIKVSSGHYKHDNWRRHSIHKALLKAEHLGATHLVVNKVRKVGAFNGQVYGTAYNCI